MYQLRTTRGYELAAVVSAMQKAIRRGDARVAGYFALEMCASGFDQYCWRRLLTISAEDCWGILTQEVKALQDAYKALTKGRTKEAKKTDMTGWVCVAKAVILMAEAKKSRDADHLVCFIYDQQRIDAGALAQALAEADPEPIPDYAYDCHTARGKRAGKTKAMFFQEEFVALSPREPGLFDDILDH